MVLFLNNIAIDMLVGVLSDIIGTLRDVRDDFKRLIKAIEDLNNNIEKLESFSDTVSKLAAEIEELNNNMRVVRELLRLLGAAEERK